MDSLYEAEGFIYSTGCTDYDEYKISMRKKKVFNDIELARNANAEWTFFLMTCISSASSAFHHREWICRVFTNFLSLLHIFINTCII